MGDQLLDCRRALRDSGVDWEGVNGDNDIGGQAGGKANALARVSCTYLRGTRIG